MQDLRIKVQVTNDRVKIDVGPVIFMELDSKPEFKARLDRAALIEEVSKIVTRHKDEVVRFIAVQDTDEKNTWAPSSGLRNDLLNFRELFDGRLPQLPNPPSAGSVDGGHVIRTADFIEWAKRFELKSQEARLDENKDAFGWMFRSLQFVKALKRTGVKEFTVSWSGERMVLDYHKGKAVLPVTETEEDFATGGMDFLFRSFVEHLEKGEREAPGREAA